MVVVLRLKVPKWEIYIQIKVYNKRYIDVFDYLVFVITIGFQDMQISNNSNNKKIYFIMKLDFI